MAKKPLVIKSDFALLDVKDGRKPLFNRLGISGERAPIPVTITGFLTYAWGQDDGTSREFAVDVVTVSIVDDTP